jgi:imidazolonepropionase-like amidohydrolase
MIAQGGFGNIACSLSGQYLNLMTSDHSIFGFASLALLFSGAISAAEPYASTYPRIAAPPTVIENAIVLTGTCERLDNASVLFAGGQIQALGNDVAAARENFGQLEVVDAGGRWVTPGLIDVHSHLGVYPSPGAVAHSDGNEATAPATPNVWVEHSLWPQDPGFPRALAGGVTSMQLLPGSANLFGGRSVTIKNLPANSYQAMKFPGAPHGLKMACGENPKRVYGTGKGTAPGTRMGNVAGYREQWSKAQKYIHDWETYETKLEAGDETAKRPERDLGLDTLSGVLRGEILVHMHCYRADEMMLILDLAREFGYSVSAFHHGVETYKIADELAEAGVCAAIWSDWWGFKMEAYDGIQENIALTDRPEGSCAIVHSDSGQLIQRLNVEAAKAMTRGQRLGLDIPPERAIRWITSNPARSLGIQDQTGTLEPGKMADVVIWNGNPFSVYALADRVYIDGAAVYDRFDPALQPVTDFELGQIREVSP